MSDDPAPSDAFADMFTQITTVAEQVDTLNAAFDELMAAADNSTNDPEEDGIELLVAAVGAVAVSLRVLAQHLQETIPNEP